MTTTEEHKVFNWQTRVYWQDTDAGGVVYHPSYLNFAQQARSEYMREHVCKESEVREKYGILLVVRHAEIDYRASARLDDILDVSLELEKVGGSSLSVIQHITRAGVLLAVVKMTLVAISDIGKPVRIPPQLRQIFGK